MSPSPTSTGTPSSSGTSTTAQTVRARTTFLLLPGLALLAGLDAALLLSGAWAPVSAEAAAHLPARHGILMTLGFLGCLIALERAVALRAAWGYAAPACLGVGGLVLALGLPALLGAVLLADGAALLLAVYVVLYRRRGDATVAIEALGATSALVASLLWLRLDTPAVAPWLVAFIVATIAAERVDLARLHLPTGGDSIVLGLVMALVGAAGATLLAPDAGHRAFGLAVLALVAWLGSHDVARRTIRSTGLPRFSAAAMLAGYGWLGLAGAVWLVVGRPADQPSYDLTVHATFLGFAMSMVLAHAPVILPAIVRRPLPYHRALWVPLAVLHAGLAVRLGADVVALGGSGAASVGAGDPGSAWRAGAVATVIALLLLPPTLVTLAARGRRARRAAPPADQTTR